MKNKITFLLATLAPLTIISSLIWIFRLHGTRGLFHLEALLWVPVTLIILLCLIPLSLAAIAHLRSRKRPDCTYSQPIIIVAVIVIILPVLGVSYLSGFPSSTVDDAVPRLILAAANGSFGLPDLAVVVQSKKPSQLTLTWGKAGTELTITEDAVSTRHLFMLRDLEPAAAYWYRINQGPEYHFTTPIPSSLHFAVGSDAHFGDGASHPDLTGKMLGQIADPVNGFDYFFSLGDLVEAGFRVEQWQTALTAVSPTLSSVPAEFAAGNHDTLFTGLNRYLDYCYPAKLELQNGTRLWHRFDVGNVHFLILDVEWSVESFTAGQQSWLETELKSIPPMIGLS
jgi:acid phosphatase type 7